MSRTTENDGNTSQPQETKPTESDVNPRSPKRRRLSSDVPHQDNKTVKRGDEVQSKPLERTQPQSEPASSEQNKEVNPSASSTPVPKETSNVLTQYLPLLDRLATQILSTLANNNTARINAMLFGIPTAKTHEYKTTKSQFEQTRRIFAKDLPFLSAEKLGLKEPAQVNILRKANMATFAASAFSGELGLRMLDVMFLDVFISDNGTFEYLPGQIYIDLKTQAFIAARRTASVSPYQAMLDLFPPHAERALLARRPGSKDLTVTEQGFLKRLTARRDDLYNDIKANTKVDETAEKFRWEDFSGGLNAYVACMYGSIPPLYNEEFTGSTSAEQKFTSLIDRALDVAKNGDPDTYPEVQHDFAQKQLNASQRLSLEDKTTAVTNAQSSRQTPSTTSNAKTEIAVDGAG